MGLTVLFGICGMAQNQSENDSTGLPGDHFSLEGALEMFRKAGSPEEFETLINTKDNNVNNLDLNGDGNIDYVRVVDKNEKDAHAFVLQVPVSESESQDVAVIELEKKASDNAVVQIVGDEDLYGESKIVEPDGGGDDEEDEGEGGNGGGPYVSEISFPAHPIRVVVNVWTWPLVRVVYAPGYRPWVSPWRWRVYPTWWHPWKPLGWRVFHPFRARYRSGYAVARTHRVLHAHRLYTPVRVTSVTVKTRHQASVNKYRITKKTTIKPGRPKLVRPKNRVGKRRG